MRAGCDVITVHWEAVPEPGELLRAIRAGGALAGLAVNPPTPIVDTTWIKPGKTAWDWWSGSIAPDVPDAGMNTATIRPFALALSTVLALAGSGSSQDRSATFALSGVLALVGSRGRHLSWVVFLAISGLVWLGGR